MKQKLTGWLLIVRRMSSYLPFALTLVVVAAYVFAVPCPATGGGPGGGA